MPQLTAKIHIYNLQALPDKLLHWVLGALQHIRRSMTVLPPFLALSPAQQRSRFSEISLICDHHLEDAFSRRGSPWAVTAATTDESKLRNRYSNVFPFDRTRVTLPVTDNACDYINASKVNLSPQGQYIAAQGPLRSTVHHFWAMCFDQAVKLGAETVVVAMVTPLVEQGREKCAKYWPLEADPKWDMREALRHDKIKLDDLTVSWMGQTTHSDGFVVTNLQLQSGTTTKTVLHYYYEAWQDTKVPDSVEPLISLSEEIASVRDKHPNLVPIVHCSAGVGRTGTFIAVDYLRNLSNPFDGASVDPVFEVVKQLRTDRMMMVQTVHQYQFLYDLLTSMYREKRATKET